MLSAVDAEVGRTTDTVRMYMREMGTVELLTREGEIAIAKRIEDSLNQVQSALASFPWSEELTRKKQQWSSGVRALMDESDVEQEKLIGIEKGLCLSLPYIKEFYLAM